MSEAAGPAPGTLRVAAIQAASVNGDVSANVATAARLVRQAAEAATDEGAGLRVALLPESFLTGYDTAAWQGEIPEPDDLVGAPTDWDWLGPLRAAANDTGAVVVVGTTLRQSHGRTLSLIVVRPHNSATHAYDKQHLCGADEKAHFVPGEQGGLLEVDGWVLGLGICYDGSFPEHGRAAADAGATAYLISAAFPAGSGHRHDLYARARALDNLQYVVFSDLIGSSDLGEFSGGSAVHDPEGRTLEQLGTDEGFVIVDLDPVLVADTRRGHPMLTDRRRDLERQGFRRTTA